MRHDCTNLSAASRMTLGYVNCILKVEKLYSNLANNETIKIITHRVGGAAAKGFIKALIKYAEKNNMDHKILFELDLAPFEWWNQKGNSNVSTYTLSHWFDMVAGPSFMKSARYYRNHLDLNKIKPLDEHSIDSFRAIGVLDGIIKGMKNGDIKVTLDGKRIN